MPAIIAHMFIEMLTKDPQQYWAHILVVIISICLHELGHGFAAIALGDRTPEETGHITLNPMVHMGPISLGLLALTGFAWGLMPVDRTRLRGRYADALVAFAGPAVNLGLAGIAIIAIGLWSRFGTIDTSNHMVENAHLLLFFCGILNLALFALNLAPLPPLDGSRVLGDFWRGYRNLISNPGASGVMLALMVGWLVRGGSFIVPFAGRTFVNATAIVAGHPVYPL